jgi:hypothetical protein
MGSFLGSGVSLITMTAGHVIGCNAVAAETGMNISKALRRGCENKVDNEFFITGDAV